MSTTSNGMNILIQLVLGSVSVIVTAYLLPGVHIDGFLTALVLTALLALLNITVKPLLIILTIPITIVTLGLFLLAINAILILLASEIIDGFHVNGFWWALAFALILSLVNSLLGVSLGEKR